MKGTPTRIPKVVICFLKVPASSSTVVSRLTLSTSCADHRMVQTHSAQRLARPRVDLPARHLQQHEEAVEAIFVGRARLYNRRFLQMCSHYLVEPVACTPAGRRGRLRTKSPSCANTSSRRGCGSRTLTK